MNLIFEKSKTTENKKDLAILFRKVRSSDSCCVSCYIELCEDYDLDLNVKNENKILNKLHNYIIDKILHKFYL